ncbi:MAG TPA: hypothetical protein VN442_17200 [Bryobacteraceae bacterium]|nr:hypothetical protein [Bryobacteraceae bacterium]HWR35824.1 hypothetical protein [Clostridia bacterium]
MLGPEYWDALNSAVYFTMPGSTAHEAFEALVDCLSEGYWYQPGDAGTLIYPESEVIPVTHTARRGFVLIEDSADVIALHVREAARRDAERPWLLQWAAALEENPDDVELRAQALVNLPDGRILDPDGPLGCLRQWPDSWLFFGFPPIEAEGDEDERASWDWDEDNE